MSNISDANYPLIKAPWKGEPVWVKLRILTQAQIMTCGNFSLIETFQDKIAKKKKNIKMREIVEFAERQYNIVKESLVSPTYDEIMQEITQHDCTQQRKELEELEELLLKMQPGPKKSLLEEEIAELRIKLDFLLPEDFISYIVCYALEIDKTDIKKITEDALIEAGMMAEKYKKRPSEILCGDGIFSEFNKLDIDRRSMQEFENFKKEHKK